MRENIFELMKNSSIDLYEEYHRLNRLFRYTYFEFESSIMKYLEINKYFLNWKHRKRFISIEDLLDSLQISNHYMDKEHITIKKLLLYSETIYNLINCIEYNSLEKDSITIIDGLKNNILDLLEDMNYEIEEKDNQEFIIIEKDKLTTAIAEKMSDITADVIEYRRFSLKGDIEAKREILKKLANKIEPLRSKLKGTSYNNIIDDVNMLLNNLNIRHNNFEGKNRKEYTVMMSNEELEKWYDKTYDMILGVFMLENYIDSKPDLDLLKSQF